MVSKALDEQNIRALFQSYGAIEDCTVLRDANGKSRGESIGEETCLHWPRSSF